MKFFFGVIATLLSLASGAVWSKNPGTGMQPSKLQPYELAFKDGFRMVTCARDSLYEYGDKFGNNKFSYNVGNRYNVSIIHYTEMIPKEDRRKMTPNRCFQFCRTLPSMHFFGIVNGRDCYCTPFFEVMASDSSQCDSVCEGDKSQLCGGRAKSTIFEMHACQDTANELRKVAADAQSIALNSSNVGSLGKGLGEGMQAVAERLQKVFGHAGDPVSADLMQMAKVAAGKLEKAGQDAVDSGESTWEKANKGFAMLNNDFSKSEDLMAAEKSIKEITHSALVTEGMMEISGKLNKLTTRGKEVPDLRKHQYYPIMYFVDKKWVNVPATCGGDVDKYPLFGVTLNECAAACDFEVVKPECVGYSYYDGGICFLFSKFKTVKYWTKCPVSSSPSKTDDLLQIPIEVADARPIMFLASRTHAANIGAIARKIGCSFPSGTTAHSLITFGDAHVAAHNVYTKMTIGGNLLDDAPGTWHAINGKVTVGGTIQEGQWNFNGGKEEGVPLSQNFNWAEFEELARNIKPGVYPGAPYKGGAANKDWKVMVMTSGGSVNLFDIRGSDAQAYDHGTTLVVFNTNEDVVLEPTPDLRQFGPSVLAPFSKVTLKGTAGFIDGFLVAKELGPSGEKGSELQMHGVSYGGPIDCEDTVGLTTTTTTTPTTPTTPTTTKSTTPIVTSTMPPPLPTTTPFAGGGLVGCFVKFEDFENTDISPDQAHAKMGRCKNCLKEAEEAQRCWEGGMAYPWEPN